MMKDDDRDILIDNKRLIFSSAKMTWNEGEAYCQSKSGRIANILDAKTLSIVLKKMIELGKINNIRHTKIYIIKILKTFNLRKIIYYKKCYKNFFSVSAYIYFQLIQILFIYISFYRFIFDAKFEAFLIACLK